MSKKSWRESEKTCFIGSLARCVSFLSMTTQAFSKILVNFQAKTDF